MTIAISYLRWSDPSQGTGTSKSRQQDYAARYCQQHGLTLANEMIDAGRSAFKGRHLRKDGQFRAFLDMVADGRVPRGSTLIIENVDRASRLDPYEGEKLLLGSIIEKGITIHVASLGRSFDRKSLGDVGARVVLLLELTRSNSESNYKRQRLSVAHKKKREQMMVEVETKTKRTFVNVPPAWIKVVKGDDGKPTGYEVIEEKAAIVKRIFQLALDGYGYMMIVRKLNDEEVPAFRGKLWQKSSIDRLLHNVSVLGHYQPQSTVVIDSETDQYVSTARAPVGPMIRGHFPKIIDQKTFDKVQRMIAGRINASPGQSVDNCRNLFSGVLRDARRPEVSWTFTDKGEKSGGPSIMCQLTSDDSPVRAIRYQLLEDGFMAHLALLDIARLFPASENLDQLGRELDSLQLMINHIDSKIAEQSKNYNARTVDSLLDQKLQYVDQKQKLEDRVAAAGSPPSAAATETLTCVRKLRRLSGDDKIQMRRKVRELVRGWVKTIYCLPMRMGRKTRGGFFSIELISGQWIHMRCFSDDVCFPPELDGLNAVDFNGWPKASRKLVWDAPQAMDQKILAYSDETPLQSIADALGISVTQVSRTLKRAGRSRGTRTDKGNSDEHMTWFPGGRGWTRVIKGKRYYIPLSKLKKTYPKLYKDDTREGSCAAANRWIAAQIKLANREHA